MFTVRISVSSRDLCLRSFDLEQAMSIVSSCTFCLSQSAGSTVAQFLILWKANVVAAILVMLIKCVFGHAKCTVSTGTQSEAFADDVDDEK